ncbi:MAG: hypothetical protein ABI333_29070 [bacterium]
MWLKEYLHDRWGLISLVGGVTLIGAWMFGSAPAEKARKTGHGAVSKPGRKSRPAPLTSDSATARCVKNGIPIASPAQPRPAAVKHPGFPTSTGQPPRLQKSSRGLFPLRKRLAEVAVKRLAHAPLLHRLARGFAERQRFFGHLSRDRGAAARYYRRRAQRRPPGAAGGPTPQTPPPPTAAIVDQANTARVRSLAYYRELTTSPTFAKYQGRPAALLERAGLLMTETPPRGVAEPKTKKRRQQQRTQDHALAVELLQRLIETHPSSPEGVEAMAYLADRQAAAGACAKVLFLLRRLPTDALGSRTPKRQATLRAFGHYLAGRCLTRKTNQEAAVKRLALAVSDGRVATRAGSKQGQTIAREAAILLAQAVSTDAAIPRARRLFAASGPELALLQTGVLAARLVGAGKLREAVQLCTSQSNKAPRAGAK